MNLKEECTLNLCFFSYHTRKPLSGATKVAWNGNGTNVKIQVPMVLEKMTANFWMSLISNRLGICLTSWLRPQNMTIFPNPQCQSHPVIFELNPVKGKKNCQLWISGCNFSACSIRVVIGDKLAVVYSCSSSIIKCIVPDNDNFTGQCDVQVANANVFTTSPVPFTYE